MTNWLKDVFGTEKPIIGMCHILALPGDPGYDAEKGMDWVVTRARQDLLALQRGGVDAILFSNEFSLPYLTKVETITSVSVARVIGELKSDIRIPYGVNMLWDPSASIDVAMATGGQFVREIFTGVYSSDFGLWNTDAGKIIRHQHAIGAQSVKLFFNIVPEAARYIGERDIADIARSTIFNARPDALCVSGLTAGAETSSQTLEQVKNVAKDTPVFANTGVRENNVQDQLAIADGAIVGTAFKYESVTWNAIEEARVASFMSKVRQFRTN